MNTRRRVILFDLYRTLIDISIDEQHLASYRVLARWLSYRGFYARPEQLRALYSEHARRLYLAQPGPHADVDIEQVFCELLQSLAPDVEVAKPLVAEICVLFRALTTESLDVYPQTRPLLESLAARGYRLAIVSNAQRAFSMPELESFGLVKFFEHIVFSSDLRLMKPRAEIFAYALGQLDANVADAVFVGDNMYDDMWGAQQLGLKTVWIDRDRHGEVPRGTEQPNPNAAVRPEQLRELPGIVDKLLG
jgi:putative hydrolase of the HAD superfamily